MSPNAYFIGEQGGGSRTLFDDKIAAAEVMRYPSDGVSDRDRDKAVDKKLAWVKSTRNYLISKAGEMEDLLKWAEDFQSQPVTPHHVQEIIDQGHCLDSDPHKLSRDLWGYLNLAIPPTSGDRVAFDNAAAGNGLDAWRRIVDPLGPRSEERLFKMHKDIISPKVSQSLTTILHDLEDWESDLKEYYRCGGDILAERTKMMTVRGMLPGDTPSSVHLALRGVSNYEAFKRELRITLQFLNDHGGMNARGRSAHVIREEQAAASESEGEPANARGGEGEAGRENIPALIASLQSAGFDNEFILSAVQNYQRRQRRGGPGAARRPNTPPRDAKDLKCANCGGPGHIAANCTKPKVPIDQRKCHTCGKTGHLARACPNKSNAKLAIEDGTLDSATARGGSTRILCIKDEDGFTRVHKKRPMPRGGLLGDLPVFDGHGNQAERRANRFAALAESRPHAQAEDEYRAMTTCGATGESDRDRDNQRRNRHVRFCDPCLEPLYEDDTDFYSLMDKEMLREWPTADHRGQPKLAPSGRMHPARKAPRVKSSAHREVEICANQPDCTRVKTDEPNDAESTPGDRREQSDSAWALLDGERADHAAVVSVDIDEPDVLNVETWPERSIEMILDSGACRHVLPVSEISGYEVQDSPGSRRGQCFIVGNGEPVPNEGQVNLNLVAPVGDDGEREVTSVFQVAELNSNLMSVSQICDNGYECIFSKNHARVVTTDGEVVCQFNRERNMYVTKMRLRPPSPFGRQDP